MAETVFDRDKRIRKSQLTMGQTFYLTTLNQIVGNNPYAWASQMHIAWKMNASTRAVRKWQTELQELGVIQVDVGKGRSATNRYRLNLNLLIEKEEPRASLNAEPHSSFIIDSESERGTTCRLKEEPRAYEKRNHVPTERTLKEHTKEHMFETSSNTSHSFEEFWDAYAKKTGRKKAETAFARAIKADSKARKVTLQESAMHIIQMAGKYASGFTDDRQFQKHPTTWLTGQHWEDDPATWRGCQVSGTDDWPEVWEIIRTTFYPDLMNSADVKEKLSPDQFNAAKSVGLKRIANADKYDTVTPAAYRTARKALP